MKKFILFSAVGYLCSNAVAAPIVDTRDSLRLEELEEVVVSSTRAGEKTPMSHIHFSKEQIAQQNQGKDLPFLLSLTPSVTVSSDAGNGIGYTSIRVRGIDPSRINITANGIPMNDAESSQVYWVNMGDFASSAENMQIQRGVGTSTNGAGAFGATVNIQTANLGAEQSAGYDMSAGSYGTHKETFKYSTGLLGGHWGFQGRLSNVRSDGYLDRAFSKLNSYFLQGGYYGENTVVKFITFNGVEQTYHAWNYTSKYEQSLYGRTYNSCGEYYDEEGNVHYYDDQTDNYRQQHYQLLWDQRINYQWNFNLALHYTHGQGYYEEYKTGRKLEEYLLKPFTDASGNLIKKTDLIRQKKMENDFYGFVGSINFNNHSNFKSTLGGGWNQYDGDHFGLVKWVKNYSGDLLANHKYYDNTSRKIDGNIYAKANWAIVEKLNLFADLQYRHVSTKMEGPSDDFVDGKQVVFNEKYTYDFFNPKAGLFFDINRQNKFFASVGISHKEPTRNDYEDNIGSHLKAEKLVDTEVGYKYQSPKLTAGLTYYLMNYTNQFVLTGKLNEIGEMIASNDNSGKSYRTGLEAEFAYQPAKWFRWDLNATWSRNRNKHWTVNATEQETWADQGSIDLGETPISFSPDWIFNNIFTFKVKGLSASIMTQYVGEQYITNTGFKSFVFDGKDYSMMLDDYCKTDIDLTYSWSNLKFIKGLNAGITLYNIFSAEYDNNGWAYCEIGLDKQGKAYAWSTDQYEAGFAPQAPFNFLAHISINF
ncbi:MAG: TonB-dependent receptor [Bacteroidales bacterium]|nr:TonB-dependent receptor [Bacteroidales bacterium]